MGKERSGAANTGMWFGIFFIMLFLNTLPRTRFESFWQLLGEGIINLTLFAMLIYLVKSWTERGGQPLSLKMLYVALVLYIAINTFGFLHTDYADGYYFLRVLLLLLFILGAATLKTGPIHARIAGTVSGAVTLFFLLEWMVNGLQMSAHAGIYRNENYLAVVLFCMLYFSILPVKYSNGIARFVYLLLIGINLVLILTTSARSVLIGILVAVAAWIFLKLWQDKFKYLFYVVLIGNFIFMAVYIGLKSTALGRFLNDISLMLLHKNLFSGRIEIWEQLFHAIKEKPFFGYGIGIDAMDVMTLRLTAHNLFLQLLLENGIVGFLAFVFILFAIWRLLNRNLDNFVARWSACFMLGIIVYDNFELTMTQNNLSVAMFQWLILTFGVAFSRSKVAQSDDEKIALTRVGADDMNGPTFAASHAAWFEEQQTPTRMSRKNNQSRGIRAGRAKRR